MASTELTIDEIKEISRILRGLSIDQVETAKSGHPGLPLGCADVVATLFCKYLRFNPEDPDWPLRDRFVLSAGHGSALLYSLLALFNYSSVTLSDLKNFRKLGSPLAGHPESHLLKGVEATTGPLGQGIANAVGLALASKLAKARDATFSGYRVFCLCSDGDLMEGISYEACSLAGFLGLDNLFLLYDDNRVSLAGPTDVCFRENIRGRFEAQGWIVWEADGLSVQEVDHILAIATNSLENKPKLIIFRTIIGFGSSKAGTFEVHGSPLGVDDTKTTKNNFGLPDSPFWVSEQSKKVVEKALRQASSEYTTDQPYFLKKRDFNQRKLWSDLANFVDKEFKDFEATRNIGGKILEIISRHDDFIVGGSADLEPSTKAYLKGQGDVNNEDFKGRNIRFGVREHAMAGIANGLALTGWFKPFVSTFLCFLDYLKPSLRLSALSHLPVVYIFTHDSIFLGEDGPTHQPIEHLNHLRSIPDLFTFRPANFLETAFSYFWAFCQDKFPSAIILTRQNVKQFKPEVKFDQLQRGGYIARQSTKHPKLTILASGSEVSLAIESVETLGADEIDVVSVFCFELLEKLDSTAISEIIRAERIVFLEASSISSSQRIFERFSKGAWQAYSMKSFGASGKDSEVGDYFGFSVSKFARFLEKIIQDC